MKIQSYILGIALFLAMALNTQAQCVSAPSGAVAWWAGEANAKDALGTNDGTLFGGVSYVTGKVGQAFSFDGSTGYIAIPDSAQLHSFSNKITIELWMKQPSQNFDWMGLVTKGNNSWQLQSTPQANTVYMAMNGVGSLSGNKNVKDGQWHHVAGVYDGANIRLYVDGALDASVHATGTISEDNSPVWISGIYGYGNQYVFNGLIDEVTVYNRALSSNEIAAIYNAGSAGKCPPPVPPILTRDLTNTYVQYGQNVTIGVNVASTNPAIYQWYFVPAFNTGNGAQAGAYAQIVGGFVYGAIVTNGGFGYGSTTSVNFIGGGGNGAAGYTTQSNGVVVGITVTNAGVGYTNLPSVVIGAPNGYLFGQTNSTLTITNANQNSLGNYWVVVNNYTGSVTSSVVNLTLLYPPSIASQPSDFNATAFYPASFNVSASGTTPLSYQWLFSGTNIIGATNVSVTITNARQDNIGQYSVVVTNAYGSITSSIANLYLYPYIANPFTGLSTYWGYSNTLSVGAWGSGIGYQWYFNGLAIPNATSATYTFPAIQPTNAGLYTVVISSPLGSVTNTPYQVVVNPANVSLGLFPGVIINGVVGYNYAIQGSSDLSNTNGWLTLTNITLSNPIQIWYDGTSDTTKPANPHRYYRVLEGN